VVSKSRNERRGPGTDQCNSHTQNREKRTGTPSRGDPGRRPGYHRRVSTPGKQLGRGGDLIMRVLLGSKENTRGGGGAGVPFISKRGAENVDAFRPNRLRRVDEWPVRRLGGTRPRPP